MQEKSHKLTIEKIIAGGRGLGYLSGKAVFVDGVIDGETVDVCIKCEKRKFLSGWPTTVIKPSEYRKNPSCPYHFHHSSVPPYSACGGCSWQHIDYSYQLVLKKKILLETLSRIGKITNPPLKDVIPSSNIFRYRNKAQIPVALSEGKVIAGFFAAGSHRVIDAMDCLIQPEVVFKVVNYIKSKITGFKLKPYDENNHTGSLRYIFVRTGNQGKDVLVGFVVRSYTDKYEKLALEISEQFPEIKGVVFNENPGKTNVIFGKVWKKLTGESFVTEELDGKIKLRISYGAFFQVNTEVAKKLYSFVAEQFTGIGFQNILDLYCGVGGFALSVARYAQSVIGVEENNTSVTDACINAQLNGIRNVNFFSLSVEEYLKKTRKVKNCGVILDPPRSGLSDVALSELMRLKPDKIIYISCEPSTFSRDASVILKQYKLLNIQPFDMFPQTPHLELVATFQLIKVR